MADGRLVSSLQATYPFHRHAGVCAMTSPPDSMKDPLLDCPYHGSLRFASLPRSRKRAYSVHLEFFDGSNHLLITTYDNSPLPSIWGPNLLWARLG